MCLDAVLYRTLPDLQPIPPLPPAATPAQHLRNVFYRMGLNDQEIVALSGAHTLGRGERGTFVGFWPGHSTCHTQTYKHCCFALNLKILTLCVHLCCSPPRPLRLRQGVYQVSLPLAVLCLCFA